MEDGERGGRGREEKEGREEEEGRRSGGEGQVEIGESGVWGEGGRKEVIHSYDIKGYAHRS